MKVRSIVLVLLGLVALSAAWFFWPRSSQPATDARVNNASSVASANTLASVASASTNASVDEVPVSNSAAVTNRLAFRLSNDNKELDAWMRTPHAILLENAMVDTDQQLNLAIPRHLRASGEPGAYLVQTKTAAPAQLRALLNSVGAEYISYIPNNACLVRISAGTAGVLRADPLVQAVLPWEPYYKVQASLLGLAVQQKALPPGQLLTLGLFEARAAATIAQIEQMGGVVIATDRSPFGPMVRISPPKDWTALAQLPGVLRLEPTHRRALANDLTRVLLGVATNSVTTNTYLNLTGSNVVVEVNDTGIDTNHPALLSRVLVDFAGSGLDTDGHGTHVAGIIAGDGTFSGTVTNARGSIMPGTNTQFRGKAPLAKLFSFGVIDGGNDPVFVSDQSLQETPALTNALISNNSWVNDGVNEYDLSAASYDAATRDALTERTGPQPVLFVFAAGNDGAGGTGGTGGNADSILSPGTAKNVITVGALEQLRNITNKVTPLFGTTNDASAIWQAGTDSGTQVADYSARGNVGIQTEGPYGRFKPDVIAPGSFVVSTRSTTWDTNAYFNVTNYHTATYTFQYVTTNTLNYYSVGVPQNCIGVIISVTANANSPSPFPQLPIYASVAATPDTNTHDIVKNNLVSIPPDAGGSIADLSSLTNNTLNFAIGTGTNPVAVYYDVTTQVITTNDLGDRLEVLHALDDGLGAPPQYYRYETGTSMAAPAVSGVLALMQDFFTNRLSLTPSPALLKAMLINGARVIGGNKFAVTNSINYQGWGVPKLTNSIPLALTNTAPAGTNGQPLFFVDQSPTNVVATGDRRTYLVSVPTVQARGQALRVTLAWTDPPGNPAAAVKLVNDLDLVITNLSNGQIYYGNNFSSAGSPPFSLGGANTLPDVINNVENIYLSPTLGTNYSITVVGRSVNVNAVTLEQTNIVQDFALVVACGDGNNTNGITFTATAPSLVSSTAPTTTYIQGTNGILFNQIAGGNAPWLSTNTLAFGTNSGYATNAVLYIGQTNQWHFFIVTNTFATTNANFTNAAFITFLPATMATPRMGTYSTLDQNSTRPEADLELYVADTPVITNLDVTAISNCVHRVLNNNISLGRGGTEFVAYSNSQPNQVYYIGVKCEDQMAGRFAFISVFSDKPFSQLNPDGSQTVNGQFVPVNIPDGNNAVSTASYSIGLALYPMHTRRLTVTNVITHQNFGDLIGGLTHDGQYSFLNNHDGFGEVNFTNLIYDDSGEISDNSVLHTDAPGSLLNFNGKEASGLWVMNQIDDAQTQTGRVDNFSMRIYPHKDLGGGGFSTNVVPPLSWYYEYVDVPVGNTNILVVATNLTAPPGVNPMQLYLDFDRQPDFSNYLARAELTNGTPPGNSVSYGPPLEPGRYWVGLYNPNNVAQTNLLGVILSFNAAAVSTLNFQATEPVPLLDDAVTYASTFVTNTLPVQSINVGLRVDHERISDLAFHLISPNGNRYLLMENRGNQSTNGAGITIITTNTVTVNANGGSAAETNSFDVGMTSGTFPITYNFYSAPDQMTVYYGTNIVAANLIYDSGMTNNPPLGPGPQNTSPNTIYVSFPPATATGPSTYLTVVMNQFGNTNSQTEWTYTAGGILTNYYYLNFTENTNLTTTSIKFAPTPFVPFVVTNVVITTNVISTVSNLSLWYNSFEGAAGNSTPLSGSYFAGGWFINAGSVDQITNGTFGLTSYEGQYCLDLNGSSPGTISTNVPTTAGTQYTFSFAYARNPDSIGAGTQPSAQLSIGGSPTLVVTPTNINSWVNLQWATTSVVFTATSSSTAIQFASQNSGASGVMLDAVRLQPSSSILTNSFLLSQAIQNPANGHYYYLMQSNTWTGSESNAVIMGGHLATINDSAENTWVLNTFSLYGTVYRDLWIGLWNPSNDTLTRAQGHGTNFVWANGETSTYRNWSGSEPNNGLPGPTREYWTYIYSADQPQSGLWNDLSDIAFDTGSHFIHGVVEFDVLTAAVTSTNYTTNIVTTVSNLYYLPEQSLESIIGMNPYGEWQLEILDNRAGATNNANLVGWQLLFTFANTNFTIPTSNFTNGLGPITNTLAGGATAWYLINVPTNADLATNSLLFSTLPLNMWFSTNVPPTITNAPGDVALLTGSTGGNHVLGTNGSAVNLTTAYIVPGGSYYLGFQNPNVAVATYAFDVTFRFLPAAPSLITLPATSITSTSAVLNAAVVPNGLPTGVYFQYGTNTSYGLLTASTPITVNLTSTNFIGTGVSNLLPGMVYHFRAVATNALGTTLGADLTFTNLAELPIVITQPATNITFTTATLKALVNPGGANTLLYFQYGLTTNYTFTSASTPITANLNLQQAFSTGIASLTPGSIYHFRAVATNIIGTNYGLDLTFTNPFTGTNPLAFTAPATLANGATAQLNGFATANGSPSYAWFEWGTSTGYGVTTPVVSIGTNYTVTFVTNRISGLFTNLPYHFRLVVSNGLGVTYGFDQIFDQANVVAWGADYAGQIFVPSAALTNLVYSIGAGYEHSLAVSYNNTAKAWGINVFGQTNVPASLNTAVAIGGGKNHSLAMRSDRTVVAWGSNQFGQTNAPGTNSGIVGIAVGGTHNLALRTNGLVMAWGANSAGQTNVPARATNVVSVSAGDLHSLALRADGTVVAWGYNGDGETNVPPGLTNVVAISAGNYHNLALKGDGTVVAWGSNNNGETNVPAGLTNIIAVAGGGYHSLALRNDGLVIAWGDNSTLQTVIPPGLSNVVAIAGGGLHSLALSSIYGLNQTNNAPFWTNSLDGSTVTMNENTTFPVTNTAVDTNYPAQALTYTLLPNSLPWVTINAQGIITITPTETNGPSTNVISTVVTDNGKPALSSTNSFTLVVNEINTAPFWATNVPSQTNYNVVELRTLTVTNTALDADRPTNALTYALFVSPPTAGATITTNGIITWTPTEAEGPAVYTFTTIVTDTNPWAVNAQSLTATNFFTVTVLETNSPPFWTNTFAALAINELETNTFNAAALDPDVPVNTLQYRLTNSPAWASIDTNSGSITFLPLEVNGPSTNTITVIVTDNGLPPLSATTNFTVVVNEVNTAPFWPTNVPSQSNYVVGVLNPLTVTNTAVDLDLPTNLLTYALTVSPTVTNAAISPDGIITWTPTLAQGPGVYVFTTTVTDTNLFALTNNSFSVTNTFTVTVTNSIIAPATNNFFISSIVQTNIGGTNGFLLTWFAPTNYQFQVQWKDGLLAPSWNTFTNIINYNLFITPTNSQFQFFDDGTQSGGFNPTRFYQLLTLALPNTPPVLPLPTTRYVTPLSALVVTNTATDADVPAQTLTYVLTSTVAGTNPPAINAQGIITWTPTLAQAGTTHLFTTIVTDNGSPNLSATNSFAVAVYSIPTITSVMTLTNGVSLQWSGFTNQQFQVRWTTNLAPPSWTLFPDIITSTNGTFNFVDTNTPALLKFYQLLLLP